MFVLGRGKVFRNLIHRIIHLTQHSDLDLLGTERIGTELSYTESK